MHTVTIEPFEIFQAASDPIRVRILRLLAKTSDEACLCEFSDTLEEPDYKVSRHLKVLRQAGLLSSEKEGRWVYYRLITDSPHLAHLSEMLKSFPDAISPFKEDLSRFKKQKRLLAGNRCRKEKGNRMPPRNSERTRRQAIRAT